MSINPNAPPTTEQCEACLSKNLDLSELGGYLCRSCGIWGVSAEELASVRAAGAQVRVEFLPKDEGNNTDEEAQAVAAFEDWMCPHGSLEHDCSMLCVCFHPCRLHVDAMGPCGDRKCVCSGFQLSLASEEAE